MPIIAADLTSAVAPSGRPLVTEGMIQLTPDAQRPTLPMDLIFVLDTSASMKGPGINTVIDAVLHVQNMLRPEDRMMIVTFDQSGSVHCDWVRRGDHIPPLVAGGGTNFGAGINTLLQVLGRVGGQDDRAGMALFMSDGRSKNASESNVASITSYGYTMHCLGVTHSVQPQHLDRMAELARGRYFSAPSFEGVKGKFQQLFNYGSTVIYSAPLLNLQIPDGVVLENLLEVNGTVVAEGPLYAGDHAIPLGNLTSGTVTQVSFRVKSDLIHDGLNPVFVAEFSGERLEVNVSGTTNSTLLLQSPTNTAVALSRQTARTARALKLGDAQAVASGLTKLRTMAKTLPRASTTVAILEDANRQSSDLGAMLETIGTIAVDRSGKTVTRTD